MAVPFSRENFNAREEILSGDLNRAQRLLSRDVQDVFMNDARWPDGDPLSAPGTYSDVAIVGTPLSGAEQLPTIAAGTGFQVVVGAGSGFLYDNTVTGDDSKYLVVRWAQATLTHGNPDPTNPRIDLIVAVPAEVTADPASRNILVDPDARTVAAQTVNKTANPVATLSVVAGTAAASPVAPAVPAGALALFEVGIPAAAANSAAFWPARRMTRRSPAVVSASHGVLSGVVLRWGFVDNEAAPVVDPDIGIDNDQGIVNRAVIDGQYMEWGPNSLQVFQDTSANPFGSAAPSTNDRPYYVYLCGGHALPQLTLGNIGGPAAPAILVESRTAPTPGGYPSAPIVTPRGSTQRGALFVGVGYTVKNTTHRKGCYIEGDWVYGRTGQPSPVVGAFSPAGFNDDAAFHTTGMSSGTIYTIPIATAHANATRALFTVQYANSVVPAQAYVGRGSTTVFAQMSIAAEVNIPAGLGVTYKDFLFDVADPVLFISVLEFATAKVHIRAKGYNMRVPRLGAA